MHEKSSEEVMFARCLFKKEKEKEGLLLVRGLNILKADRRVVMCMVMCMDICTGT